MSDLTFQERRLQFIQVVRTAMQDKKLNNLKLAKLAGIGESTVRKVLNEKVRESEIGPHPQVIRAICQVLDLDLISIYQLLDYFPSTMAYSIPSEGDERMARRINRLSGEKKKLLLDLLVSIERSEGLEPYAEDEKLDRVLHAVGDLRRNHPMFEKRRLGILEEFGHLSVRLTPAWQTPPMRELILRRLTFVCEGNSAYPLDDDRLSTLLQDQAVVLALQMLLPRKDMPSPLEKLYWLCIWNSKYDTIDEALPDNYRAGLRALWQMLNTLPTPITAKP